MCAFMQRQFKLGNALHHLFNWEGFYWERCLPYEAHDAAFRSGVAFMLPLGVVLLVSFAFKFFIASDDASV